VAPPPSSFRPSFTPALSLARFLTFLTSNSFSPVSPVSAAPFIFLCFRPPWRVLSIERWLQLWPASRLDSLRGLAPETLTLVVTLGWLIPSVLPLGLVGSRTFAFSLLLFKGLWFLWGVPSRFGPLGRASSFSGRGPQPFVCKPAFLAPRLGGPQVVFQNCRKVLLRVFLVRLQCLAFFPFSLFKTWVGIFCILSFGRP